LAGLAAAMVLVARGLRGQTAYPDAVFPLALLNLDQYPTVSGLIIALRGEVGKRIGGRGHVLE